jgi:Tfp pilus assembly protein PilF
MTMSKFRFSFVVATLLIIGVIVGALLQRTYSVVAGGASSEATVAMAEQALDRNDRTTAYSLAYHAIPTDPDSYLPYLVLSDVYSRQHEALAARGAYEIALRKLSGPGGHFRVLKLDASMRQTERNLIRKKLVNLPAG